MNDLRPLALSAALFALWGCPDPNESPCPEPCERGLVCDAATATCVPDRLPRYERPLPGRSARVASGQARIFTASIDPSDGNLVVAEHADGGPPDARILTRFDRPQNKSLAVDANGRFAVVAWLGPQARYELAYRRLPTDDNASWRFATVPQPEGGTYLGTEAFDLEIVDNGGVVLAFRDRSRSLRLLSSESFEGPWTIETIDDGGPADDGTTCPDEVRRLEPRVGVGVDPDIAIRDATTAIAYHDADCGDLRLARRTGQRWNISVVDTGVFTVETEATRGIVGRWPSVDVGPTGAVAIAYHDVSRGRLLYARENSGRFDIEVADAGLSIDAFSRETKNIVGAFAHLTRSDDGAATVTYLDGTSIDLKIARRPAASADWSSQTLANDGPVGFFADHVVEPGRGRYVVCERLTPSGTGLASELVVEVEEE